MSVAVKPVYKDLPFLVAPYHSDEHSILRPKSPEYCPENFLNTDKCQNKSKGWRPRKCGPGFPLSVWCCLKHRRFFTIYPPGWGPYDRAAILDVAPDGSDFNSGEDKIEALNDSILSAAIDAAFDKKWPEEARSDEYDKGVFKTQKRHISGILKLLGIAPDVTEKRREIVTATLGIPLTTLHKTAEMIRDGPKSWRENGLQIMALLKTMQPTSRHSASFQILGSSAFFWGQPCHCP